MRMTVVLVSILIYLAAAPVVGLAFEGYDRVVSARMQNRKGPSFFQPLYDLLKLFQKQSIVVNRVQTALVVGFVIFTIFTGCIFFAGGDILLVFFAHSLADMFLILAAYSANSPYSSLGAQREFMQTMAYEPMTLLTAIGFYMTCGSFNVYDIIQQETPAIVRAPGIFLGFCFTLLIIFRKSPFDLATSHHAHQEMVKGLTQDLAGNIYGLQELGELYASVQMLSIAGLFFICKNPLSYVVAVIAVIVIYFFVLLADNIFPRVKWEVMLSSTWIVTFVLGGGNFLILTMLNIAGK